MLKVCNLCFAYEDKLFRYDLSLERGSCLALLGTSGAGKSSFLNLLAGFEVALSGVAEFDGDSLLDLPPHKRPITMIFQEHNLFPHLCVLDNVAIGLGVKRLSRFYDKARESLWQVGLAGFEARLPSSLSGGERRRVALARAYGRDKPLLLLDEPFTALHPALRYEMLDLLDKLRRKKQLTVILVTHLPDEARRISDKIAFIEEGRILCYGDTDAILDNPPIAELARYLGQN